MWYKSSQEFTYILILEQKAERANREWGGCLKPHSQPPLRDSATPLRPHFLTFPQLFHQKPSIPRSHGSHSDSNHCIPHAVEQALLPTEPAPRAQDSCVLLYTLAQASISPARIHSDNRILLRQSFYCLLLRKTPNPENGAAYIARSVTFQHLMWRDST